MMASLIAFESEGPCARPSGRFLQGFCRRLCASEAFQVEVEPRGLMHGDGIGET
jgi:hypothetical protein